MRVTMHMDGLRELEQRLGTLAGRITRRAVGRRALEAAGEPIRAAAQAKAPDDPGTSAPHDLKLSIAMGPRQKGGREKEFTRPGPGEVRIYVGPTKEGYPQAIMQEFGTVHHAAQPYMRPAWDTEGGEVAAERVGQALAEEIEKATRRQAVRQARAARRAARRAR